MEKFRENEDDVNRKEKIEHAVAQELLRKHNVLGPEVVPLSTTPDKQITSEVKDTSKTKDATGKRNVSTPSSFFLVVIGFVAFVLLLRFLGLAFSVKRPM